MWDICQKAISQKNLILQGTGKESRDFVHALDIARAIEIISMCGIMQGEVYNLGSGQEITIAELAAMLMNVMGSNNIPQFSGKAAIGNPLNWCADISKLKSIGFTPTVEIERGVKTFANWCRAELVQI